MDHYRPDECIVEGAPAKQQLNMGGAPPTRERSVCIDAVAPMKLGSSDLIEVVWLPMPPPEQDLMEHLGRLALLTGVNSLEEALSAIRVPNCRLMAMSHPATDADEALLTPERQLRNALLLAKTGTLVYDPDIPPVFTRRRLERSMDLIRINLEDYYELD